VSNLFSCADIYGLENYAIPSNRTTEDIVIVGRGTSGVTYPSAKLHSRADLLLPGDEAARAKSCRGQERTQERSGPSADYRTSVFQNGDGHEEVVRPIRVEIEINKSAIDDLQKEGMMDKIFYYRLCGYLECTKTA
jgi:hypothetical protein